jgi:hypothetical protein
MAWIPFTVSAQILPDPIYSAQSVNDFCQNAQQIVATTSLESINLVHGTFSSFVVSSSAPYEGPNLSSYNGDQPEGGDLPLTTQQFNNYQTMPYIGWVYPDVISCKLKNAESIQFHFGVSAAGAQAPCADVVTDTLAGVRATLTRFDSRWLFYDESRVVVEADLITQAGPVWTSGQPDNTKAVAIDRGDGILRLRGIALPVERTDPTSFVGPDKKGVYYCHLPSAHYVYALIRGFAQACGPQSEPVGVCID